MVKRKPKRKAAKPRKRALSCQSRHLPGNPFAGAKPVAPGDMHWWDTLSPKELEELWKDVVPRESELLELVGDLLGHLKGERRDAIFKQLQTGFEEMGEDPPRMGERAVEEAMYGPVFADFEKLWEFWCDVRAKFASKL